MGCEARDLLIWTRWLVACFPSSLWGSGDAMVILSWSDVDQIARDLRDRLAGHQFDAVVGVARAGLIPAVMLSHMVKVREFGVLDIRRTLSDSINSSKQDPSVNGELNLSQLAGRRVLLVDDIVGAGSTMIAARRCLETRCSSITTTTLVVNESNLGHRRTADVVDFYGTCVRDWVVFPWEGKELHADACQSAGSVRGNHVG